MFCAFFKSLLSKRATKRNKFFDEDLNPIEFPNSKGRVKIPGSLDLNEVLRCREPSFVDLVQKCLAIDPKLRYTALCHPWILEGLPENLQAQHLKLLQNDASKKEGAIMKENIVPVPQVKTTEERTSRQGEVSISNDDTVANKSERTVNASAAKAKNTESNVMIAIDTQGADATKPKCEEQTKSTQVYNLQLV